MPEEPFRFFRHSKAKATHFLRWGAQVPGLLAAQKLTEKAGRPLWSRFLCGLGGLLVAKAPCPCAAVVRFRSSFPPVQKLFVLPLLALKNT
jgi:hypothetical protein